MKPKSVHYHDGKVGSIRWHRKPMAYGKEVDGYSTITDRRIVVRSNAPHSKQAYIIFHELLHQSLSPIVLDSPVRQGDVEEILVQTVATNMALIWKRNPSLFTWIHLGLTSED